MVGGLNKTWEDGEIQPILVQIFSKAYKINIGQFLVLFSLVCHLSSYFIEKWPKKLSNYFDSALLNNI